MSEQSEGTGVWIFVSHCHLDSKKVRQVRDALEKDGHNPILFFLKCLSDTDARLPQLIKDEIEARTWFILCRSENSEKSLWVQEEVRIVTSTRPRETFATIDLAEDFDVRNHGDVPPFMHKLRPLLKRATVFLSYSRRDAAIADQIHEALVAQDYRIPLGGDTFDPLPDWQAQVQSSLNDALDHGFVLVLLSPEYLTSPNCKLEREWALDILASRPVSNIVPVIIHDPEAVYRHLPGDLRNLQCIDVTKGSIAQNVAALLSSLKSRPMT
jgi:hypothetical protein